MEYIRGVNILHAPDDGVDKKAVAGLIVDSMLKQIFIDGFFHGDPHAGNILLVDGNTIAYLDFGIVGHLSEELRAWIFDILYGMSKGDITRVINSFLELCNVKEDEIDLAGYRRQMNEVLSELQLYEMAGIPFSQMMKTFLYTSLEYGIRIPHEFVLVTKSLTTFEGTCLSLDPEIRIVELLRAFVDKHVAKLPAFDEVMNRLAAGPFELMRLQRLVLKHGSRVVKFIENPVIRLAGEEAGGAAGGKDRTGENIAHGFIIAALIVFAALAGNESVFSIWLSSALQLRGLPVLPLVSLSCAALLGVNMMLKNRGQKGAKARTGK
jgi:ubiquinone biosynthesis protein